MPSRIKTEKLSPAAQDRWWRDRIEKEEGKPAAKAQEHAAEPIAGDHLIGAGAMVKPLTEDKDASIAKSIALSQAGKGRPGSVIPTQLIRAASKAGSVASHASYPKTPALSQAGESVTSSVIASRLHRLEQELIREKLRRQAAEKEMMELMKAAAGQTHATM